MAPDDNSFASPQADVERSNFEDEELSEAHRIRSEYLEKEAEIKEMGSLFYGLAAILTVTIVSIGVLVVRTVIKQKFGIADLSDTGSVLLVSSVIVTSGIPLSYYIGWGLQRLDARVRHVTGIMSAIVVVALPVGLISSAKSEILLLIMASSSSACLLYMLYGRVGRFLFSERYREVIRLTPEMRCEYKTSWNVLAILLGGLAVFLFLKLNE